ncbi:MAG: IS1634 family transposase [Planctomycetota bacterium]
MSESKSRHNSSDQDSLPSTDARSKDLTLSSYTIGSLPLINRILDRIRFEDTLEGYLKPRGRQPKMPYSKVLLLLLRNLIIAREPLYGVGEWAALQAPDLLGIQKRQIKNLNDDRVGRSLDRLFDADHVSLLLTVTRHVIREFHVDLDQLHNDSTTISLFGKYENAFKGRKKRGKLTRAILFGHNKDHRPDLKQLLFILTVSRDGGVPIHFTTSDGNVTDDQTHRQTWDLLCQITGRKDFLYVADSKLATTDNMSYIQRNGGRFVTILPRTRSEDSDFREFYQWSTVELIIARNSSLGGTDWAEEVIHVPGDVPGFTGYFVLAPNGDLYYTFTINMYWPFAKEMFYVMQPTWKRECGLHGRGELHR